MEHMNLLVSLDERYLPPLQVLLTSLHINNPDMDMTVYLMHSGISDSLLQAVEQQCRLQGISLKPLYIESAYFQDAPVTKQYPQEMYYRLLAPFFLPKDVHRILYLDPDTLGNRPAWQAVRRSCPYRKNGADEQYQPISSRYRSQIF